MKKDPKNESRNKKCKPTKGKFKPKATEDKYLEGKGNRYNHDTKPINDISWYTRYPQLTAAAAAIPYPYRPGMEIPIYRTANSEQLKGSLSNPGVMAIEWCPTVGYSATQTDPISICCKEIYSKVRSKFSGSLEADAPDFIMYLMALDSIFSYIGHLKRIYRIVSAYTPENYIMPDYLMGALGFSSTSTNSLRSDKVLFWQRINELILMTRKFTCPAVMDLFNRHYWMNDNVYMDRESLRSQMYVFKMDSVYMYAPQPIPSTPEISASGLVRVQVPTNFTYNAGVAENLFQFGKNLIDELASWDDSYTIAGYLMRAYEGSPNFEVALLNQDEQLTPVFEPEVLLQIQNTRAIPGIITTGLDVSQEPHTNVIICQNTATIDADVALRYQYLMPSINSMKDTPDILDSVIATRLLCDIEPTKVNGTYRIICGTEVILGMYIITGSEDLSRALTINAPKRINSIITCTDGTRSELVAISRLFELAQWDYHPSVYAICVSDSGVENDPNMVIPVFDIGNMTTFSEDTLKNLHRVCIYSELNAFNA